MQNSPWSVKDCVFLALCLSSLPLSVLTHTRARHLPLESFMKVDLHDHNPVTPSPGRLSAAECSNFPMIPLRRNRNETSMLTGVVSAGAILFQEASRTHGACEDALKQESLYIFSAALLDSLNGFLWHPECRSCCAEKLTLEGTRQLNQETRLFL